MRHRLLVALAALFTISVSCVRGPRDLVVGEDPCEFCRMTITDARFGGQVVTAHGTIRTFDSIECLASFVAESSNPAELRDVYVADYFTRTMVRADEAVFLRGGALRSPMGRDLAAVAPASREKLAAMGGELLRWSAVLAGARITAPLPAHAHVSHKTSAMSSQLVPDTITVDPASSAHPIADAVSRAAPGAVLVLTGGRYRESTVTIDRALTLDGRNLATLDGEGVRGLLVIAADDVTVRGVRFLDTGHSAVDDRAALRVTGARRCLIEDNAFIATMFGVYLERATGCVVRNNALAGPRSTHIASGNGIHLWYSDSNTVQGNRIRGHRDGIYFEFAKGGVVIDNESEANARYGLHFMFSDDCRYERNRFSSNQSGVAVMYSRRVVMRGNRFVRNWGSAAYGLLLKDISDSEIRGNEFIENSVALHLEGSNRNAIEENSLERNGWAIRLMANAQDNVVKRNRFAGNTFDVTTNSRQNFSTFTENSWDRYRGYDLNRDGIGDVPHRPVRLFALIVEQSPPTMILQHSILVDVLDFAERMVPSLTPETLADARPVLSWKRSEP
jgi:nitrous oxidase accessory protein